ncbi:ANTAR domain-containing protein [Streptomyces sp. Li-HN-5-11]|uniref:ANTAR domain-containing protein n=1 Tax=Streptomyces sp. Li-HN-5-11 TaxID=3075432 RepID=UPI0028AA17CA|nr:ANTAR domain-containing protein [Streptomyces sp. Li-HN-5-11]WNM32197.1 ANTAR domain-containing protein [Streptomyces sp. Li-HN-5-11]
MESSPGGDRVVVAVRGELDLDVGQLLQRALREALARSTRGLDLDLSGVAFCDCSALNILIGLRRRALADGKTVTVRATSPVIERLFDLTDTLSLFTADGQEDTVPLLPAPRDGGSGADTDSELRVEVAQLRRAMQTRPSIDLARGILMASFGLTPEQAWSVLVLASQNTNTKLHHLAGDVLTTVRGAALPETLQRHLTEAVAQVKASATTARDDTSGAGRH